MDQVNHNGHAQTERSDGTLSSSRNHKGSLGGFEKLPTNQPFAKLQLQIESRPAGEAQEHGAPPASGRAENRCGDEEEVPDHRARGSDL